MAKTLKARITFIEDVLGTSPNDEEIYSSYIGSKAPNAMTMEEEIDALGLETVAEKGKTVFGRDKDGDPIIYDYQIRGFLKAAFSALKKVPGMKCASLKAFKKIVDTLIYCYPRKIKIHVVGGPIVDCQRPLRASTPQGDRVTLANSEAIPRGSWCIVTFEALEDDLIPYIREALGFGLYNGIGQWRNSGKGQFYWEELDGDKVIGGNKKDFDARVAEGFIDPLEETA